jgi:hypothetical protein
VWNADVRCRAHARNTDARCTCVARKAVRGIDRHGSVFSRYPSHGRLRPHSSGSGRHHPAAPSIMQRHSALIQASSSPSRRTPSFNGSDPPSGAPSINPIRAPSFKASRSPHARQRPQSSNQAVPVDATLATPAPSFKPIRSQVASTQRPHSRYSGLRPSLRDALIQADQVSGRSPLREAIQSEVGCAKSPKHYLGK